MSALSAPAEPPMPTTIGTGLLSKFASALEVADSRFEDMSRSLSRLAFRGILPSRTSCRCWRKGSVDPNNNRVVVIGASAGGMEALLRLCHGCRAASRLRSSSSYISGRTAATCRTC